MQDPASCQKAKAKSSQVFCRKPCHKIVCRTMKFSIMVQSILLWTWLPHKASRFGHGCLTSFQLSVLDKFFLSETYTKLATLCFSNSACIEAMRKQTKHFIHTNLFQHKQSWQLYVSTLMFRGIHLVNGGQKKFHVCSIKEGKFSTRFLFICHVSYVLG